MSIAEAEDGGVEYMEGGREESRTLPVAMLGGRELPGDEFAGIWSRKLAELPPSDASVTSLLATLEVSSYLGRAYRGREELSFLSRSFSRSPVQDAKLSILVTDP